MLVKCSFCHQKYIRSSAYKKHLRIAHANLDIILVSTTANLTNDFERDIYNTNNLSEHLDSNYKCEQGNYSAIYEGDRIPNMPTNDSNTNAPDEHTLRVPHMAIIQKLQTLLEMSKGIRKTTVICVRTNRRHSEVGKASNL